MGRTKFSARAALPAFLIYDAYEDQHREFDWLLKMVGAAVDHRSAQFWREIADHYPDACEFLDVPVPDAPRLL
jgi:hypothetical protein